MITNRDAMQQWACPMHGLRTYFQHLKHTSIHPGVRFGLSTGRLYPLATHLLSIRVSYTELGRVDETRIERRL